MKLALAGGDFETRAEAMHEVGAAVEAVMKVATLGVVVKLVFVQ